MLQTVKSLFIHEQNPLGQEQQIFDLLEKRGIHMKYIRLRYLANKCIVIKYLLQHTEFRIELTNTDTSIEHVVCFLYRKSISQNVYVGKFRNIETCLDYISILSSSNDIGDMREILI